MTPTEPDNLKGLEPQTSIPEVLTLKPETSNPKPCQVPPL